MSKVESPNGFPVRGAGSGCGSRAAFIRQLWGWALGTPLATQCVGLSPEAGVPLPGPCWAVPKLTLRPWAALPCFFSP